MSGEGRQHADESAIELFPAGAVAVKIRHGVEYILLRAATFLFAKIPYRAALSIGWAVAFLMHWIFRFRVRAARRRMHSVFGAEKSAREIRRLAWLAWRNFVFSAVDMIRLPELTAEWFRAHVDASEVMPVLEQWRQSGNGMIVASPHMGSWTLGGAGMALMGLPVFGVAGKQRNPCFEQWTRRWQARTGLELVFRGDGQTLEILSRLQHGKIFAIMPDVRMPQPDLPVRFLGHAMNMGSGVGMLARYGRVPVLPVYLLREGWTRHRLHVLPMVYSDPSLPKAGAVRQVNEQVMAHFERLIRQYPGQWFWYNSRWLLDPVAAKQP